MSDTRTVELDAWELDVLKRKVAGTALGFMGHYCDAGLLREEVDTMNRWLLLSAKLAGEEPPEPLLYRGTRRNGFNPDAD